MNWVLCIAAIFVVCLASLAVPAFGDVRIVDRPTPTDVPSIPWVEPGDTSWREGEPLFEIGAESTDCSAVGWAAASDEGILLRVVVTDEEHGNHQTGRGSRSSCDALEESYAVQGILARAFRRASKSVARARRSLVVNCASNPLR